VRSAAPRRSLPCYGREIDPGRLNAFLIAHDGYTPKGWLFWEKAAESSAGGAKYVYEGQPSYFLIDSNLLRANPAIVWGHLRNGTTHLAVIVGKRGLNYLVQDPDDGGEHGIYQLRQLLPKLDGLRLYQRSGVKKRSL